MSVETATPEMTERVVEVWNGRLKIRVKVAGDGPPLVYLHSTIGPAWDRFLTRLTTRHTVYLPEFPGTTVDDPYAVHVVDELSDLVLVYDEIVRGLGLQQPVLLGHSFGAMLAAEMAAYFPTLPGKLVLLAPVGLWRDDAPVTSWSGASTDQLPGLLFHDVKGPAVAELFGLPQDVEAMRATIVGRVWSAGCTGKFLWPIPDRGLRTRLHRISADTLIVWGREDRMVPVSYADEFAKLIENSTLTVIDHCGHVPQLEQFEQTVEAVDRFLS